MQATPSGVGMSVQPSSTGWHLWGRAAATAAGASSHSAVQHASHPWVLKLRWCKLQLAAGSQIILPPHTAQPTHRRTQESARWAHMLSCACRTLRTGSTPRTGLHMHRLQDALPIATPPAAGDRAEGCSLHGWAHAPGLLLAAGEGPRGRGIHAGRWPCLRLHRPHTLNVGHGVDAGGAAAAAAAGGGAVAPAGDPGLGALAPGLLLCTGVAACMGEGGRGVVVVSLAGQERKKHASRAGSRLELSGQHGRGCMCGALHSTLSYPLACSVQE